MTDPTPTDRRDTDANLHMFDNEYDCIIAHDVDEAIQVYEQTTGTPYHGKRSDWFQRPDDREVGLVLVDETWDSPEAQPDAWPEHFKIEKYEHPIYGKSSPQIFATARQWCEHVGKPSYFSCTEY